MSCPLSSLHHSPVTSSQRPFPNNAPSDTLRRVVMEIGPSRTTPGCLWPLFNLLQLFYQDNRTIHNPQSKTGTNGGICYLMAILYLAAPAHMRQVGDMFKFKQIFLHLEETSTTSDVDAGIENVRKVDANHANPQLRVVACGGIHISNHAQRTTSRGRCERFDSTHNHWVPGHNTEMSSKDHPHPWRTSTRSENDATP